MTPINYLIIGLLVVYSIFGLSAAAISATSFFAFPAALTATGLLATYGFKIGNWLIAYLIIVSLMFLSWLGNGVAEFQVFGSYLTACIGAIAIIGAYAAGVLKERGVLFLLALPALVNLAAYLLDVNLTAELFDVSADQAATRFSGVLGNANLLATALVLPGFVYLVFILGNRIKVSFFGAMLCALIILFSVLVTGSRKTLVFLIVYLIGLCAVIETRMLVIVSIIVGVLSMIFIFFIEDISAFAESIETVRRIVIAFEGGGEASADDRAMYISVAPALFLDAPLFGHGFDRFKDVSGMGVYSHNNFIEILVNQGVFGVLVYYGILAFSVFYIYKRENKIRVPLCLALVFISLDITGVTYLERNTQIIFLLTVFIGLARVKKSFVGFASREKSHDTYS